MHTAPFRSARAACLGSLDSLGWVGGWRKRGGGWVAIVAARRFAKPFGPYAKLTISISPSVAQNFQPEAAAS